MTIEHTETCLACFESAADSRVPSKCGHNALCESCYDRMRELHMQKQRLYEQRAIPQARFQELVQSVLAGTYANSELEALYWPPRYWNTSRLTDVCIPMELLTAVGPDVSRRWDWQSCKAVHFVYLSLYLDPRPR